MTVLAEVCTPPHVRRIDRFQNTLDYPLQKDRDERRAEHKSSRNMFPPIKDGLVVELSTNSPKKPPGTSSGMKARPSTAQFFEAAKVFHTSKGHNKELRQRLMESHMTFMNWRIPASRSASAMSSRPGTSLQKLGEAKELAGKKSPYTKEDVPKVEPEKLLSPIKEAPQKSARKPVELPEKEKAVLVDWISKASLTDKLVISDLVECADRLTVTTVTGRKFRPGPAAAIKMWLKNANDAEKQIAEKFLDELDVMEVLNSAKKQNGVDARAAFGPLIDRSRDLGYRDGKTDKDIEILFDSVSKELAVPVTKPFLSSPRYAPHFGPDRTPAALWHLDQNRDVRYLVLNNTANFINPSKDRGSHFDIHPDWPNYYS